jgi:hypothetical protein
MSKHRGAFATSGTRATTQRHIPEELNLQQDRFKNLNFASTLHRTEL